jgi:hypothetical protein
LNRKRGVVLHQAAVAQAGEEAKMIMLCGWVWNNRWEKKEARMPEQNEEKLGKLALALSLGGVVLAFAIGMLARWVGQQADRPAFLIFTAFQIAAIVLGLVVRRTPLGKAAAITAALLAVGAWTLLS